MKGNTHIIIGASTYANYIMLTDNNFDLINIPICLVFSVLPDIDIHNSKISSKLSKLPINIIVFTLSIISFTLIFYFTIIKKIIPSYYIFLFPIMVLFLKLFSKNKILKKISLSIIFIFLYYMISKYTNIKFTKNILLFLSVLPYFEHRGLSHSITGMIIICALLYPMYLDYNLKRYYITIIISYFSHLFLGDIFTKKGIKIFYPFSKKNYSLNIFKNKKIYNNLDIPFILIFLTSSFLIYFNLYKKL